MLSTSDFIEALRSELKMDLREEILSEIRPIIERLMYANILTVKETAAYLKLSPDTVRKMMKGNEIEYFEQRGQFYCRQQDLDRYIASKIIKRKELHNKRT